MHIDEYLEHTRNIAHMGKVLLATKGAGSKHTINLLVIVYSHRSLLLYDALIPCLYHRTRRMVVPLPSDRRDDFRHDGTGVRCDGNLAAFVSVAYLCPEPGICHGARFERLKHREMRPIVGMFETSTIFHKLSTAPERLAYVSSPISALSMYAISSHGRSSSRRSCRFGPHFVLTIPRA